MFQTIITWFTFKDLKENILNRCSMRPPPKIDENVVQKSVMRYERLKLMKTKNERKKSFNYCRKVIN